MKNDGGWFVDTKRWTGSSRTGTANGVAFISGRVCEGGTGTKSARVACVLFEMRTLSKAASEKGPNERRKDTSV